MTTRRRFLTDLACIGGALALAAGLGATPPPPPPTPAVEVHYPQYSPVIDTHVCKP